MTLMEFSIVPLDKGAGLSEYVGRVLEIVDDSGLSYCLNPMGTVVEGEWQALLDLLNQCFEALKQDADRISVQAKFDYRRGVSGAMKSKIASIEKRTGRTFNK